MPTVAPYGIDHVSPLAGYLRHVWSQVVPFCGIVIVGLLLQTEYSHSGRGGTGLLLRILTRSILLTKLGSGVRAMPDTKYPVSRDRSAPQRIVPIISL
jgi:hypothetical protein